jgi:hypothetical protein
VEEGYTNFTSQEAFLKKPLVRIKGEITLQDYREHTTQPQQRDYTTIGRSQNALDALGFTLYSHHFF